jgi:hypothetical protein
MHIGLWDVEAPMFSLENRLTDGGKFVSLSSCSPLPPNRFPVLISVRDWVDTRATLRLEGLALRCIKNELYVTFTAAETITYSIQTNLVRFSRIAVVCISFKTKLRSLSPKTNYTDLADCCISKLVPNLLIEGVAWSAQPLPTAVNLNFLDR